MVATRSSTVFTPTPIRTTTVGKKPLRRMTPQSKKPTTSIEGERLTDEETEGILINCIIEPEALMFDNEYLQHSRTFIMRLVTQNGLGLKHAATFLREDSEIVMAAVTQNSEASIYMGIDLHSNEEIWKACCRNDVQLINFNRNPEMQKVLARLIIDEKLFPDEQFERQMLEITQ